MITDENPYRKLFSEIVALIFSYSLIFYLLLYLAEAIFPGFVTDNFPLNWILIPTLIFGVLSALFPTPEDETKEKETKKASLFDLIFTITLSIGAFFLIFYKFKIDNFTLKLTVSFLSSFLALMLGVILLYFPDESEKEGKRELGEGTYWTQMVRRSFVSRIHIPVPLALLFAIIMLVFIPKNTLKILSTLRGCTETECAALKPNETPSSPKVLPEPDPNIKIVVFNASAKTGEANRFVEIFKSAGYKQVEAKNYNENIENALLQFRESESPQADLIESIIRNEYLTVIRTPLATTSAEVRVILGKQPPPASYEPDFENENFDFFFQ